jgi:hypothetical protein
MMIYTIFAPLLKVAGWIIIPIGVAALTGGYKHDNQLPGGKGVRVTNMAGLEKEIKKAAKGSSAKKGKKSGGKKSGSGVEKAAKKLLK